MTTFSPAERSLASYQLGGTVKLNVKGNNHKLTIFFFLQQFFFFINSRSKTVISGYVTLAV